MEIKVGQMWQDKDKREVNRILVIVRLTEDYAFLRHPLGKAETRIRRDRLVKCFRPVS